MRKFRLTIMFIFTALVSIALAPSIVNLVVGRLAEDNLTRIAEENTTRDGLHIQAMLRRHLAMIAALSDMNSGESAAMQQMQSPLPLDLDSVADPQGLPAIYSQLVEGLSIVKLNVFDLNGTTVWSTDSKTIGVTKRESPLFGKASAGEISSKLVKAHDVVHLDGVVRRIDVVETYLPLRATRAGETIGAIELYRDVTDDLILQVPQQGQLQSSS